MGSLASGKLVDLVAVRGNPINNATLLQRVTSVTRDGVLCKDEFCPQASPRSRKG